MIWFYIYLGGFFFALCFLMAVAVQRDLDDGVWRCFAASLFWPMTALTLLFMCFVEPSNEGKKRANKEEDPS